jgi:hypothetical protein
MQIPVDANTDFAVSSESSVSLPESSVEGLIYALPPTGHNSLSLEKLFSQGFKRFGSGPHSELLPFSAFPITRAVIRAYLVGLTSVTPRPSRVSAGQYKTSEAEKFYWFISLAFLYDLPLVRVPSPCSPSPSSPSLLHLAHGQQSTLSPNAMFPVLKSRPIRSHLRPPQQSSLH